MVSLYFMYYNCGPVHQSLQVTPAMQAGLSKHAWSVEELVGLLSTTSSQLPPGRLPLPGAEVFVSDAPAVDLTAEEARPTTVAADLLPACHA